MPRKPQWLSKRDLEDLRRKAEADPGYRATLADAGQPGLYATAHRGRVRFVFRYRPPTGGSRRTMQIDDYAAIPLEQARGIAQDLRGQVAARVDPARAREEEARRALTLAEVVASCLEDLRARAKMGAKRGTALNEPDPARGAIRRDGHAPGADGRGAGGPGEGAQRGGGGSGRSRGSTGWTCTPSGTASTGAQPRDVREALGQVEAVCRYQHDSRSNHLQREVAARLREPEAGA